MAERPEIILKPEVCIESWVMLEKHSKEVGAQRALEWGGNGGCRIVLRVAGELLTVCQQAEGWQPTTRESCLILLPQWFLVLNFSL